MGLVHVQIPPITIGDPVAAAGRRARRRWLAEPVDAGCDDWLPDVVGLLDDVLLLDEQATSTSAPARTKEARLSRRKFIFPPCQLLPYVSGDLTAYSDRFSVTVVAGGPVGKSDPSHESLRRQASGPHLDQRPSP